MNKANRLEAWSTPDAPADMKEVWPPGQLLAGRVRPLELRRYAIRQREQGVTLNLYSRKSLAGVPAYGITVSPEVALEIANQLAEAAQKVLGRKGKAIT